MRGGEPPERLSFSDLVRNASSEMHADDLDAPLAASCAPARAHGEARYGRGAGVGRRDDGADEGDVHARER